MNFEVFRGISNLVYAPCTIGEDGLETWGEPRPLSGIQSIEKTVQKSAEVIYYDGRAVRVDTTEGEDSYTLSVSVPPLETRAVLNGQVWDERYHEYRACPSKDLYYAIGFKAGIKGIEDRAEYYWIYKGKFTGGGSTHSSDDQNTSHTLMQYTFTSVYTQREWFGEPLKYISTDSNNPMCALFFDKVQTPDRPVGPCKGVAIV